MLGFLITIGRQYSRIFPLLFICCDFLSIVIGKTINFFRSFDNTTSTNVMRRYYYGRCSDYNDKDDVISGNGQQSIVIFDTTDHSIHRRPPVLQTNAVTILKQQHSTIQPVREISASLSALHHISLKASIAWWNIYTWPCVRRIYVCNFSQRLFASFLCFSS